MNQHVLTGIAPDELKSSRIRKIVASAESFFEDKVVAVSAPGGTSRASIKLTFSDRTIFATRRPNFRRTHIEAFALGELGEFCEDIPMVLGVDEDIMFQSDVGGRRLNIELSQAREDKRVEMLEEAIAAIFRIQAAGRQAGLETRLPPLGDSDEWIESLADSVSVIERMGKHVPAQIDRTACCEALWSPARQFVKWDCRSGNAAIDATGKVRWFDFEYCGVRHGAEDFAWLLGDETLPLRPRLLMEVMDFVARSELGAKAPEFLSYLRLYLAFHCMKRLELILDERASRGWLSKTRIRARDDVGVHPAFAAQLCTIAAICAAETPLLKALEKHFESMASMFRRMGNPPAKS